MTDAIHNVLQRLLNATDNDIFTDAARTCRTACSTGRWA